MNTLYLGLIKISWNHRHCCQWIKTQRGFKVIGGQVGIAHGHFYVVMAQDFLEGKNVPAGHHKVCCERMAKNVSELPTWKHDGGFIHH